MAKYRVRYYEYNNGRRDSFPSTKDINADTESKATQKIVGAKYGRVHISTTRIG